jgi:hypothetical protein
MLESYHPMRTGVESSRLSRVMLMFCLRSLVREYGWLFIRRVGARHPWRTLKALRAAGRIDAAERGVVEAGGGTSSVRAGEPPSIVGAGFCLKPLSPPCPSGRANHDCRCLESLTGRDPACLPAPCEPCAIRAIGTDALRAGSAFYVMTSAHDILDDVFMPAMTRGAFTTGLFVLCRYSFKPFALGLLASGLSGRLLPLDQGDCRDYKTWLLADRGVKDEQTTIDARGMAGAASLLGAPVCSQALLVERRGNVLFPATAGPDA